MQTLLSKSPVLASVRTAIAPTPPAAIGSGALSTAFQVNGASVHFARNTEVFGEAEEAEYFYQVVSGAVRTYKLLQDGRRQIGAFYLPGDVFGLEAGAEHAFSAEAISDSTVRIARRSVIMAHAVKEADLAADLWAHTAGGLRLAQEHMLLLGRKSAEERVVSFLLDMARRESAVEVVELPMSRQDIADYLGLTIETVSRMLGRRQADGLVEFDGARRYRVRRFSALSDMAAG